MSVRSAEEKEGWSVKGSKANFVKPADLSDGKRSHPLLHYVPIGAEPGFVVVAFDGFGTGASADLKPIRRLVIRINGMDADQRAECEFEDFVVEFWW